MDAAVTSAGFSVQALPRLVCTGAWTVAGLESARLRVPEGVLELDASHITQLDTAGALWLLRLQRQLELERIEALKPEHAALLALVQQRLAEAGEHPPLPLEEGLLAQIGRHACERVRSATELLAFIGEVSVCIGQTLLNPQRIRWKALWVTLEQAGAHALPIVALLTFLMGVVIAYQGGQQLKTYGANIFIVELVSLTMLRELAPLLAAIIVAGRTGSAFTAQIGTMRVTEEVDALRTIGISPLEQLVLPKLSALVIAMPLLALFADVCGVLGGMLMAHALLEVSPHEFLHRLPQVVSLNSFLIGIAKAPVFAAIIALVGCYQGFKVEGGADSVGRQTTISVVQSIFLVIVVDALFSVLFSWLGI